MTVPLGEQEMSHRRPGARAILSVGALLASGCATGAVVAVAPDGCTVKETVHIAASSAQVYDALIRPAKWWSSEHTFSKDAANLTLDARAGGCFCEKLPNGGSVLHMTVVGVFPGKSLTMRGALGPFQSQGVDGALSWVLTPAGDRTDLTLTYDLGGHLTLPGGFDAWSKNADQMLASQVELLKKYVEGMKGK
jgi:uncharacterized protein YndB with AHSA1/START domain